MGGSAIPSSQRVCRRPSVPLHTVQGLIPTFTGSAGMPLYHRHSQCLILQRRSLFWWGRRRGPEFWRHGFDRRCHYPIERADRLFYKNARRIGRSQNWYRVPFPPNRHRLPHVWRRCQNAKDRQNVDGCELPSQRWAQPWRDEHDPEWDRINKEFEQLKRSIEADPYGMLFGRRLHPSNLSHKGAPWSTFWSTFFGHNSSNPSDSKIGQDFVQPAEKVKRNPNSVDTESNAVSASNSSSEVLFKFDPVSGRMVPKEVAAELNEDANASINEVKDPIKATTAEVEEGELRAQPQNNRSRIQDATKEQEQTQSISNSVRKPREEFTGDEYPEVQEVEGKGSREKIDIFGDDARETRSTLTNKSFRNDHDHDGSSVRQDRTTGKKEEVTGPKFSLLEDRDSQSSKRASLARSSQTLFTNFKEYITSKLELEDQKDSPDTHRWPFFARKTLDPSKSKSALNRGPLSESNQSKDPEADGLETLRASDVRSQFQSRETEQGGTKSSTRINEEEAEEPIEEPIRLHSTETVGGRDTTAGNAEAAIDHGRPDLLGSATQFESNQCQGDQASGSGRATEQKPTASISTDFDNPELVDLLRIAHAESHGKVSSTNQEHTANENGETAQVHQPEPTNKKSAAVVTDSLSMAQPAVDSAVESAFLNDKGNTAPGGSSSTSAQLEELNKLLADITRVNAETPVILKAVRDDIGGIAQSRNEQASGARSEEDTPSQVNYRVLSYDTLTKEVTEANMTSRSEVAFEPLHPADTIGRLYNPGKFLPYFAQLEDQGYELFSGGPEYLIWKRTRPADPTAVEQSIADIKPLIHPLTQAERPEQQSVKQTEPAGDESQKTSASPETDSSSSSSSSDSSTKDHSHPFLRKVTRRMFLTGVITGGTCYAIGVVAEYFRTGGQDGLGPRGFTGLEGR